jgi:TPR repeat protein
MVKAAGWFQKAAAQDHIEAIYALGTLYDEGLGVERDPIEAARLIGNAARAGLVDAELDYAMMALRGAGVKQDKSVAALWFMSAANKGNPVAQNRLARLYAFGVGVEPDDAQAAIWHQLAKKGGIFDVTLDIVLAHLSEDDTAKVEEAVSIFESKKVGLRSIRKPAVAVSKHFP